jgi:hypothetical protein
MALDGLNENQIDGKEQDNASSNEGHNTGPIRAGATDRLLLNAMANHASQAIESTLSLGDNPSYCDPSYCDPSYCDPFYDDPVKSAWKYNGSDRTPQPIIEASLMKEDPDEIITAHEEDDSDEDDWTDDGEQEIKITAIGQSDPEEIQKKIEAETKLKEKLDELKRENQKPNLGTFQAIIDELREKTEGYKDSNLIQYHIESAEITELEIWLNQLFKELDQDSKSESLNQDFTSTIDALELAKKNKIALKRLLNDIEIVLDALNKEGEQYILISDREWSEKEINPEIWKKIEEIITSSKNIDLNEFESEFQKGKFQFAKQIEQKSGLNLHSIDKRITLLRAKPISQYAAELYAQWILTSIMSIPAQEKPQHISELSKNIQESLVFAKKHIAEPYINQFNLSNQTASESRINIENLSPSQGLGQILRIARDLNTLRKTLRTNLALAKFLIGLSST